MGAVALAVVVAQGEGLRAVRGPHAVELGRVPERLVGHLRDADRVRGRAGVGVLERVLHRVVHVGLVVRAVDVLAVPASRQGSRSADSYI